MIANDFVLFFAIADYIQCALIAAQSASLSIVFTCWWDGHLFLLYHISRPTRFRLGPGMKMHLLMTCILVVITSDFHSVVYLHYCTVPLFFATVSSLYRLAWSYLRPRSSAQARCTPFSLYLKCKKKLSIYSNVFATTCDYSVSIRRP